MQKRCLSCGLIGFNSNESCRRCGGDQFTTRSLAVEESQITNQKQPQHSSFWLYVRCFIYAVLLEILAAFVSLLALSASFMRHSGAAPKTEAEVWGEGLAFLVHLPSSLVIWPLGYFSEAFFALTPVTQILFFTGLFHYWLRTDDQK